MASDLNYPHGREDVVLLPLDVISGGVDGILDILKNLPPRRYVLVVNAVAEEDVDAIVLALLQVAAQLKKRFLFYTGAAFVSARLGIAPIPPISRESLSFPKSLIGRPGGLVIARSYVLKTTAQLEILTEKSGDKLTAVVLKVGDLLSGDDASRKAISDALVVGCQIAVALLIGSAETAYFGPRAEIGRKSNSKKDDR
ncbi:hypothetical protein SEUCBS139899_001169 [Sporothrix eucalyptigena]